MVIVSKKIERSLSPMTSFINNGFTRINSLNSADHDQCLDLLTKSFPASNYYDLHKYMSFFFENEPELRCLVLKEGDECVGIQCIVDRTINYFGIGCRVAGLSYTAIKPSYQNSYAVGLIKQKMFNYIEEHSDLSLGFARKAMDNYWYPYGFRGVTNFCKITLLLNSITASKSKVKSRLVKGNDVPLLKRFYNQTYSDLIGPLHRSIKLWKYYINKCKKKSLKMFVMDFNNKSIGYYILKDNVVLEIGYDRSFANLVFKHIVCELNGLGYDKIIFKTGKNHPLNVLLAKYEHSISTRFVWRGGHIARITFVQSFLNKIKNVLELRATNASLRDFDFSCNSVRFTYKNSELSISLTNENKSNIIFDKFEWTKLIFGVCPPKYLLGYKGDKYEDILRILFPDCSPQFLEIDHF